MSSLPTRRQCVAQTGLQRHTRVVVAIKSCVEVQIDTSDTVVPQREH